MGSEKVNLLGKKENLTAEQIIVLLSVSANNKAKAAEKLVEDLESFVAIEAVIINNSLLSESCKEHNPVMYDGAANFVTSFGVTDRLVEYLIDNDDSAHFIQTINLLDDVYLLAMLNKETLIKLLNKDTGVGKSLKDKQVALIVKALLSNDNGGFEEEHAEAVAKMFIHSTIHEEAVKILPDRKKFLDKMSTPTLCEFIPHSGVEDTRDQPVKTLSKAVADRCRKADADKELLVGVLVELEEHAKFLVNTIGAGLSEASILNTALFTIMSGSRIRSKLSNYIIEGLRDAIKAKALTDDIVESLTLQ